MRYRKDRAVWNSGSAACASALILVITVMVTGGGSGSAEWSQWRGDPQHMAESSGPLPEMNDIVWEFRTSGQIYSSPAFYGGKVFIGSDDGNLYCLDPENGTLEWKFRTDGEIQATPLLYDGRAFFGSFDRNLYCISLPVEEGDRPDLVWKTPTEGKVIGSCHHLAGSVIFGDNEGFIYRIGLQGETLWKNGIASREFWATPALDPSGEYGIIGDAGNSLYKFDTGDGSVISTMEFGPDSEIYSSGILEDDLFYFTDGEGKKLYCIDATEWEVVWSFDIGQPAYSTPVIDSGRIYFGSFEYMWCIPASDNDGDGNVTGRDVIWSSPTHDFQGGSSPLVSGDRVYIGSDDYNLYCFEKDNGDLISATATRGYVYSSPALFNGSIFFGSNDRSVYRVGDRPPGIVLEVRLIPGEITSDETALVVVNITDEEGNELTDSTLFVETSAGYVSTEEGGPAIDVIELSTPGTELIIHPFLVSSRSTMDISLIASMEDMREGEATVQLIVEPGTSSEGGDIDLEDEFDRTPYYTGVAVVAAVNLFLFSLLVLFRIRDRNTEREVTD